MTPIPDAGMDAAFRTFLRTGKTVLFAMLDPGTKTQAPSSEEPESPP